MPPLLAVLIITPFPLPAQECSFDDLFLMNPQSIAAAPGVPPPAAVSPHVPPANGCPVFLDAAVELGKLNGARTLEFKEKIPSLFTAGMSERRKIALVAAAAVKCGVHLGSCGKTASTIYEIAGLPKRSYKKASISGEQINYLDTIKCPKGDKACAVEAKQAAFDKFMEEIPGWPDAYMQELEPGDRMVVFNANSGPYGTHTTIFLGWKKPGKAEIIQGQWGKVVKAGTLCLNCGGPMPLVRVVSALPK